MVDPSTSIDHHLWIAGEDRVGFEGPDRADEHLAQGQVVDQVPSG